MGFIRALKIGQGLRIDAPNGRIEVVVTNIWWSNSQKKVRVEINEKDSDEVELTTGDRPYPILEDVRIGLSTRQRGKIYARIYLDAPEAYNVGHF